jgi:hypothetical protein
MSAVNTGQQRRLAPDEILRIAREDGEAAYGDLSGLRIVMSLQNDGWHVDYELDKPLHAGGGPHYVIDAETGAIISKRYEQ